MYNLDIFNNNNILFCIQLNECNLWLQNSSFCVKCKDEKKRDDTTMMMLKKENRKLQSPFNILNKILIHKNKLEIKSVNSFVLFAFYSNFQQ